MAGQGPELPEAVVPTMNALKEMFETGKYSDLLLKCRGREWAVHKTVVCHRSTFFDKACSGEFKEANESIISLDDDNPAVVDAMLCYIYTTDYDEVKAAETIEGAPLVFNVHVHIVADKYDIAALTKLAESKFAKHAMAKGAWKLGGFAQAIEQVYAGDADRHENLRKTLVEVSSQHVNELYKEEFGAGFRQMALKFPPFSSALLAEVPSRSKADKNDVRYRCPSCKRTYATRKFADDVVGYCPGCSHSKFGEHWKKQIIEHD